jgi:hypothetical protein
MDNSYLDSREFNYYILRGFFEGSGKGDSAMETKPLAIGNKVLLLSGTFPHVKIREWTIKEFKISGKVMLEHRAKGYTLEVEEGDVESI